MRSSAALPISEIVILLSCPQASSSIDIVPRRRTKRSRIGVI